MQIQINLDNLQREEIMAIKRMVDALVREVVSIEVIKSLDAADPVKPVCQTAKDVYAAMEQVQTGVDVSAEMQTHAEAKAAEATAPAESPAKRTRRTKAEMEAAKAAESAQHPATSTAETLPPSAGQPNTPVSIDDLRSALQAYTSAKGMPAGIDLLKKFGCSRISELAAKDDGTKQNFMAEAKAAA
jgi:hypothetical protein